MTNFDSALEWYLQQIKNEIVSKRDAKYFGSIEVKLNFVDGGITNVNVVASKNIKFCFTN